MTAMGRTCPGGRGRSASAWPSSPHLFGFGYALFSDSLIIFDHLLRIKAGERIIPVGFSIGAAVAAYLARRRPVAELILITPFDSFEGVVSRRRASVMLYERWRWTLRSRFVGGGFKPP